jgi:hypothetical protein
MTTQQRENLALLFIALLLAFGAWTILAHPEWLIWLITKV